MTEEPTRKNKKLVLVASMLIAFVVVGPLGYGLSAVWALGQLQFSFPRLNVTLNGNFSLDCVFAVAITNPTMVPLPTIQMLVDVELDQIVLYRQQLRTIGTLDGQSTALIELETVVNLATAYTLFNALSSYLKGDSVTFVFNAQLTVHVGFDVNVYNVTRTGSFHI